MRPFDYVFYRVTAFYKRRCSDSYSESAGAAIVAILQGFLVLDLVLIPIDGLKPGFFKSIPTWMLLIMFSCLMVLSYYRYDRVATFSEHETKWRNEEPVRRRARGWLLVSVIIVLLMTPIVLGILKHNLHWI